MFVDVAPPTINNLAPIVPNPPPTPVNTEYVVLNKPVKTFDYTALGLTLGGSPVALDSSVTVSPVSGASMPTYEISGLAPFTTATGTYVLTVDASKIVDYADNSGVGTASVTWSELQSIADLTITNTVDDATPKAGDEIQFTVNLADSGPANATNVTVLDELPSGLTLVSASPGSGSYDTTTGVWSIDQIVAGTSASLTLEATVNLGTSGQTLATVASVTGLDQTNDNAPTSAEQDVTVQGAITPTITWSNPADIIYGTPLGGTQLDATASVGGMFSYTPASGAVLGAGADQTLSVTFTPTDLIDYSTATATVAINVTPATPGFSGLTPSQAIFSGTGSIGLAGTITSNTPAIPTGDVSITIDGLTQTAAVQANGTFSTTFSTLSIPASTTPYTVSYAYAANTDFQSATDTSTTLDVFAASMTAVTPNPRNTPVPNISVTFNDSIMTTTLTSADLSLTDNGGANLITGTVALTRITGDSYLIGGLSSLTTAEGAYFLTLNGDGLQDQAGNTITGSLSTSWLMDTTPPTSSVSPLASPTTSTSFTVAVTGSDPDGAGGSPPSGIASFAIFTQTDGGSFSLWTTVTPASPSAVFTGQAGHTYGFYSVATDNAGNVQSTPSAAQQTVQIRRP